MYVNIVYNNLHIDHKNIIVNVGYSTFFKINIMEDRVNLPPNNWAIHAYGNTFYFLVDGYCKNFQFSNTIILLLLITGLTF